MKLPKPETIDEKLIWVLEQMIRSSRVRYAHFMDLSKYTSDFVANKVGKDLETGIISENRDLYNAICVDSVTKTLGGIESFQGALSAAYEFTSKNGPNLEKVLPILIDPEGNRGGIQTLSQKNSLSKWNLCRLSVFPKTKGFEKSVTEKLDLVVKDCFMRMEKTIQYAQRFWEEYKVVRDIFSHNYRFVFHQYVVPYWKPEYDESIIGLIRDQDDLVSGMVWVGAEQRLAMSHLLRITSVFEQWIYSNLRESIANDSKPTLPTYIPYLDSTQQSAYSSLRDSLKYTYEIPRVAVKVNIQVDSQPILSIRFLETLSKWGYPLWVYGKDGKKRKFPIERIVKQLEEKLKKKNQD